MGNWTFLGMEISGRLVVLALFLGAIVASANFRLFQKSGQPGWAAFVPGYNVVVAMRILGRPDWHAALFLVPIFNVYLTFKTIAELAQSFGKTSNADAVLAIVLNVFYIINLALSEDEEYVGPAYGESKASKPSASDSFAHA
jgi:hypothetical protein